MEKITVREAFSALNEVVIQILEASRKPEECEKEDLNAKLEEVNRRLEALIEFMKAGGKEVPISLIDPKVEFKSDMLDQYLNNEDTEDEEDIVNAKDKMEWIRKKHNRIVEIAEKGPKGNPVFRSSKEPYDIFGRLVNPKKESKDDYISREEMEEILNERGYAAPSGYSSKDDSTDGLKRVGRAVGYGLLACTVVGGIFGAIKYFGRSKSSELQPIGKEGEAGYIESIEQSITHELTNKSW